LPTPSELMFEAEFADLKALAEAKGWKLSGGDNLRFVLGIPAKDSTWLYVRCEADQYRTLPPIWRWCDEKSEQEDTDAMTAQGGQFFSSHQVICAPWNRLAYKNIDGRGPHNDWTVGDWVSNSYTGQCTTLAAMAIRISVEALTTYTGRRG
jgi:hypothetical protein